MRRYEYTSSQTFSIPLGNLGTTRIAGAELDVGGTEEVVTVATVVGAAVLVAVEVTVEVMGTVVAGAVVVLAVVVGAAVLVGFVVVEVAVEEAVVVVAGSEYRIVRTRNIYRLKKECK